MHRDPRRTRRRRPDREGPRRLRDLLLRVRPGRGGVAILGVPEVRFAASLTSGGGGCAGRSGWRPPRSTAAWRTCASSLMSLQQLTPTPRRFRGRRRARLRDHVGGRRRLRRRGRHARRARRSPPTPACCRRATASRCSRSGTCTSTARRASTSPRSRSRSGRTRSGGRRRLQTKPLTLDEYFAARMISDPLCLFDYTQESDGAVAVITTSADRAKDLRQPPAYILSSAHGGTGRWGPAIFRYFQAPDDEFASSGHRPVAKRLFEMAGVTPGRRRRGAALRPLLAARDHAARGLRLLPDRRGRPVRRRGQHALAGRHASR